MQVGRVDLHLTLRVLRNRNLPGFDRAQDGVLIAADGRSGCCEVVHGVRLPVAMADRVWPPPLTNGVRRNSSKKIARRCLDIGKRKSPNSKFSAQNNKTEPIEL